MLESQARMFGSLFLCWNSCAQHIPQAANPETKPYSVMRNTNASITNPFTRSKAVPFSPMLAAVTISLLFAALHCGAAPFTDDFDDGNDTGWTHSDPLSILGPSGTGSYLFPGGNAYRFEHAPSPNPGSFGTARMSSLADGLYSSNSFQVSVDVVTFDFIGSPTPALQGFGLLVHGSDIGLGTSKGIALLYENLGPLGGGQTDHITITRVINEQLGFISGNVSTNDGAAYNGESSAYVRTLSPFATNRLVLIGSGTRYEARAYQLPDLTKPIALCTATNTAEVGFGGQYTNGVVGITAFNYVGVGPSGPALYIGPVGVTWDNYNFDNSAPTGPAPTLAINSVAGTNTVTWPGEIPGIWELETSPELGAGAAWTTIPLWQIKYDSVSGMRSHVAQTGAAAYFRLRKL